MDDLYREEILEHYRHPLNYGELDPCTFDAGGKNPSCGDQLHVSVLLNDAGDEIADIKFTGQGCAISQASMSMLSEKLKGMPVAEVKALTRETVLEMLGIELSVARVKCGVLGMVTVKTGLAEHLGEPLPIGDGGDEAAWS